ncbi:hypothetical protein FQ142_04030 [Microbacterium sp. ANT_H45B]|uniref:HtaA domain-containing protein n=1 Tax=Microbacterium sp. ANT_H45B TaxID=2597346 RepID=UPI0011EE3FF0|nr:HtaA domain-containing protein [Microbacterium sp. ANT_H45B]KAA0962498.1 hypothetical protein FQ142_04030 [Microbacterium sp. ANT_H45B]
MATSTLIWPIKRSFTTYVERMDDGQIDLTGGAIRQADNFLFPSAGDGRFAGSVTFSGHYGMLFLQITEIEIGASDRGMLLTVEDEDFTGGRRTLLDLQQPVDLFDGRSYPSPQLTTEGSELFFENYPAGSVFDPVRIRNE